MSNNKPYFNAQLQAMNEKYRRHNVKTILKIKYNKCK